MVSRTCVYSGLSFEGETHQTVHPEIAAYVAQLRKEGKGEIFRKVSERVQDAGGYTTADEFIAKAKVAMDADWQRRLDAAREAKLKLEAAQQERQSRKEQRARQNEILKANGYQWKTEYVDRDAYALETRDEGTYAYLVSPDGRIVTIEQALAEIERGVDVVAKEIASSKTEEKPSAKSGLFADYEWSEEDLANAGL